MADQVFLQRLIPAPLQSEKFSSDFNSWLAVLVDTLNEALQTGQNAINNIRVGTTENIGGAGAGPIFVSVPGLTSDSSVICTIASSTNSVYVISCAATTNGFNVTFSGDPGASCILNYIIGIVPN